MFEFDDYLSVMSSSRTFGGKMLAAICAVVLTTQMIWKYCEKLLLS